MKKIGRDVAEILPSKKYPRNSEGAFALLSDGRIMFAFSRFIDGSQDASSAEIAAICSSDGGESFGEERTLFEKGEGDVNIMSVSFLRMLDGALGIFYLRKFISDTGIMCCIPYHRRSYDDGVSWTTPVRLINEDGYYVLNNDRVIRLSDGRIMLAVAHHPNESDVGEVVVYVSDDDAKSFKRTGDVLRLPFEHPFSGLQEPGVCELSDGRIWLWARTGHAYQFESYSEDGGKSFGGVSPNEFFTSPNSPMSVKKLRDGRLVAIFNPIPNYNTRYPLEEGENPETASYNKRLYHPFSVYGGRNPYVLAVSERDSKSFSPYIRILEDRGGYNFCYASIFENEDYLLVAYFTDGKPSKDEVSGNTYGINIKKIALDEL